MELYRFVILLFIVVLCIVWYFKPIPPKDTDDIETKE